MRPWIGMSVATDPFYRANFDTLIMGGGTEPTSVHQQKMVAGADLEPTGPLPRGRPNTGSLAMPA